MKKTDRYSKMLPEGNFTKGGEIIMTNDEKKKVNFGDAMKDVGKSASRLLNNTAKVVAKKLDQNDDGEFNMEDVSIVAEGISNTAKKTANTIKENLEEKNRQMEKKLLHPIFEDDLESADFAMSKLIRVTPVDKKRAESEVCVGAVGYISDLKEMQVVNLYIDKLDLFGLTFYPDAESELYYVDPNDRDRYIALDEYFNYLKVVRVNELQRIAQTLGAKHFKVTLKERKASFSNNEAKAKANAKLVTGGADAQSEHSAHTSSVNTVEISAEMECPGHEPNRPELYYLQKDESVKNLIELRMDPDSPMMHQKLTIEFSNSSGIKVRDAAKIDAALKGMKISGNATVTSEAESESRRFFEYEIDF